MFNNIETFTFHMPNSSKVQTNETKGTQQLTLSFVSKSSPSKKKLRFCLLLSLLFQNCQRILLMV